MSYRFPSIRSAQHTANIVWSECVASHLKQRGEVKRGNKNSYIRENQKSCESAASNVFLFAMCRETFFSEKLLMASCENSRARWLRRGSGHDSSFSWLTTVKWVEMEMHAQYERESSGDSPFLISLHPTHQLDSILCSLAKSEWWSRLSKYAAQQTDDYELRPDSCSCRERSFSK